MYNLHAFCIVLKKTDYWYLIFIREDGRSAIIQTLNGKVFLKYFDCFELIKRLQMIIFGED